MVESLGERAENSAPLEKSTATEGRAAAEEALELCPAFVQVRWPVFRKRFRKILLCKHEFWLDHYHQRNLSDDDHRKIVYRCSINTTVVFESR